LRAATEPDGLGDFQPLWSGQAGALARDASAAEIVTEIAERAARLLGI
jgi:nitronate monooxygenase